MVGKKYPTFLKMKKCYVDIINKIGKSDNFEREDLEYLFDLVIDMDQLIEKEQN